MEQRSRVLERRQAEIPQAEHEARLGAALPPDHRGRSHRGDHRPGEVAAPGVGGISVEVGLGGLVLQPLSGQRHRRPRGRDERLRAQRADHTLGVASILVTPGVGGERDEGERHLAVGEQREDRGEGERAVRLRGRRPERAGVLIPEAADALLGRPPRPVEKLRIAAQPVLHQRGLDGERLVAEQPGDARGRIEPVGYDPVGRRLAKLGPKARGLPGHGESEAGGSDHGRAGVGEPPAVHRGRIAARSRVVLGIRGDAGEDPAFRVGEAAARMSQASTAGLDVARLGEGRSGLEEQSRDPGLVHGDLLRVRARPVGGGRVAEEAAVTRIREVLDDRVEGRAHDALEPAVTRRAPAGEEQRERLG